MLAAVLHILRMPHKRMQINLVDDRQLVTSGDNFLNMLGPKIGHADGLDQPRLLSVNQRLPQLLPKRNAATGRVQKIEVKVSQPSALERRPQVGQRLLVPSVVH